MKVTASQLRGNIYKLLDQVLETGESLEILRHGRVLRVVAEAEQSKLDRLVARHEFIQCDPEELVSVDWSDTWKP